MKRTTLMDVSNAPEVWRFHLLTKPPNDFAYKVIRRTPSKTPPIPQLQKNDFAYKSHFQTWATQLPRPVWQVFVGRRLVAGRVWRALA